MQRQRYPWDEKSEKLLKETASENIGEELKKLFAEWKKGKKISKNTPWYRFHAASLMYRSRLQSAKTVKKIVSSPEKKKPKLELPKLVEPKYSEPQELTISAEAWNKPGARVGMGSRIDWKTKGSRAGFITLAYERWVKDGDHYFVLPAGFISKKEIQQRIKESLDKLGSGHTAEQRREFRKHVIDYTINDYANELASAIPVVRKPVAEKDESGLESNLVRTYIITSLILDGEYGDLVARILQDKRKDIVILKAGRDTTRLKGIGTEAEKAAGGQIITYLVPQKHRLPGQYASTAVDKEVSEDEGVTGRARTSLYVVAGHGVCTSKPGGGEKKLPRISLPVLHVPTSGKVGEPSIALNQIGVRTIETSTDGETRLVRTWNFRDLARDERMLVTGIKAEANELHRKIVDAIKKDPHGLRVGELSDVLSISRETIQSHLDFLLEPRALKRVTWPGLYLDPLSSRYNFHQDWFQERLHYPWPYEKDVTELRRLIFGCMHAGYTISDYRYICESLPEIVLRRNITVIEIVGDIVAGLKHGLMHRGEIISNMNYTDQEIFAAELVVTLMMKVFSVRFEQWLAGLKNDPSQIELESAVTTALLLLVYILGNHDGWQMELGVTPGVVFHTSLLVTLTQAITKFLAEKKLSLPSVPAIVKSKVIQLGGYDPSYTFPGGITAQLIHPSMARSKTTSLRSEEALDFFRESQLVDVANFHVAIVTEKWDDEIGQRVATQTGCMLPPGTEFENGKMKTVDFGAVYVGVKSYKGRIFMSEHVFYNKAILKAPISRFTDIRQLRKDLGVVESPMWVSL